MYAYVCLCVYFSLFESVLHFIGWIKNAVYYLYWMVTPPQNENFAINHLPHVGPNP